jgi:hypothetical protein
MFQNDNVSSRDNKYVCLRVEFSNKSRPIVIRRPTAIRGSRMEKHCAGMQRQALILISLLTLIACVFIVIFK